MARLIAAFASLLFVLTPAFSSAQSVDVDAASRGVARIVLLQKQGDYIVRLGHGTGFAVTDRLVVTNEHVVRKATRDNTIFIGVIPSDGGEGVIARLVDVDRRRDLALVRMQDGLTLSPLTLNMTRNLSSGEVTAVGYPGNVDRAQGLKFADYINSQPPVKAPGFITGSRPSKSIDTILHTAPIAQGNSGGPLLDRCGRVVGVNTFTAISDGSYAEFFFAVSIAELEPFLRKNNVTPRMTGQPCKSLAELEKAENERMESERLAAEEAEAEQEQREREQLERIRLETSMAVQDERESKLLFAIALILLTAAGGVTIWRGSQVESNGKGIIGIGSVIAAGSVIGAVVLWISRPGLDQIEERVEQKLSETEDDTQANMLTYSNGKMTCTLQSNRSKIISEPGQQIPLDWSDGGCVNGKTQYGYAENQWVRVFVPEHDDVISVNSYDPNSGTFRMRRYHLLRNDMQKLRDRRSEYEPPKCGEYDASAKLGYMQRSVVAALPAEANELLVYTCEES